MSKAIDAAQLERIVRKHRRDGIVLVLGAALLTIGTSYYTAISKFGAMLGEVAFQEKLGAIEQAEREAIEAAAGAKSARELAEQVHSRAEGIVERLAAAERVESLLAEACFLLNVLSLELAPEYNELGPAVSRARFERLHKDAQRLLGAADDSYPQQGGSEP